jgi:phosphatidylglycerophosphatase A
MSGGGAGTGDPAGAEDGAGTTTRGGSAAPGDWRRWVVTFGGSGMSPVAPGTVGSLAATLLLGVVAFCLNRSDHPPAATDAVWNGILILGVVCFGGLCVALGRWTHGYYGRKDPGACVLDEAAGIFLSALFVPIHPAGAGYWTLLGVLVAFRVFDISKLPPARQLERLPGGWGILLDDLAAAVYANVLCQILFRALVG